MSGPNAEILPVGLSLEADKLDAAIAILDGRPVVILAAGWQQTTITPGAGGEEAAEQVERAAEVLLEYARRLRR